MSDEPTYAHVEYGNRILLTPEFPRTQRMNIYASSWLEKRLGYTITAMGEGLGRLGGWLEDCGSNLARGRVVGTREIDLSAELRALQEQAYARMLDNIKTTYFTP